MPVRSPLSRALTPAVRGPFGRSLTRTTLASILSKYAGSHLWDFGVSADKVAAGASMTPAQFLAAYPNHNLYQDSAGTTPAYLPTHPVGLCLDQPSGAVVLGAELNSNPGPFTATTGYTAGTFIGGALPTLSIVSSLLRVTTAGSNYGVAEMSFPTVVGKTYQVILGVSTISTGDRLIYRIGSTVQGFDYANASLASGATPSDYKRIFTATGTTCYVTFGNHATPPGSFTEFNKVTVKEVIGSHASQSSTTKRPVLSARVNLLVATEDFSNAAWALSSASISANSASSPVGTLTADKVSASSFGNSRGVYASVTALAARYKTSVYAKSAESSRLCIYSEAGTAAGVAWFNLASGTVGTVASGYTATIASCGSGWFQCTVESLFTAGTRYAFFGPVDADNSVYSTASTGIYLWGADLRPANSPTNLPAYQRVTTSTDYDTAGFPLRAVWDGVDDCLVVPTLDLSITDKVTVVAGVTVQSTATLGFVYELSAGYYDNTGAFAGYFGASESPTVVRRGGGSFGSTTGAAKTAPYPATLVVQHDLSGTTHLTETPVLLLNGATPARAEGAIADTGGGNFRSDALYIGQRGGSIFPFSGPIQSITIIPALITASETAVIEASVNNSMGRVY